jgi:hypothetical protein
VEFLIRFGTDSAVLLAQSASAHPESSEVHLPYIQSIEIASFSICIDYRPKRVDMPALFQGRDFAQMAHLFPLVDVMIDLKQINLQGIQVSFCIFLCGSN